MLRTTRDNDITEAPDTRLPRETENRDRISVGWTIARISVLVVLLAVVNVLPEGVGLSLTRNESGQFILKPAFEASPSWLNLWLTLSLALCVVNLYYGRWHQYTRWADLGLSVLAVLVLLRLLKGVLPGVSSVHVVLQPGNAQTMLAQIVETPGSWSMLVAYVLLPPALSFMLWRSARKLLVLARLKRG